MPCGRVGEDARQKERTNERETRKKGGGQVEEEEEEEEEARAHCLIPSHG